MDSHSLMNRGAPPFLFWGDDDLFLVIYQAVCLKIVTKHTKQGGWGLCTLKLWPVKRPQGNPAARIHADPRGVKWHSRGTARSGRVK